MQSYGCARPIDRSARAGAPAAKNNAARAVIRPGTREPQTSSRKGDQAPLP